MGEEAVAVAFKAHHRLDEHGTVEAVQMRALVRDHGAHGNGRGRTCAKQLRNQALTNMYVAAIDAMQNTF